MLIELKSVIISAIKKGVFYTPELPKRRTKNSIKNYNHLMECYLKNSCKRTYARKWCKEHGYNYVYVTEKSNLNFL